MYPIGLLTDSGQTQIDKVNYTLASFLKMYSNLFLVLGVNLNQFHYKELTTWVGQLNIKYPFAHNLKFPFLRIVIYHIVLNTAFRGY